MVSTLRHTLFFATALFGASMFGLLACGDDGASKTSADGGVITPCDQLKTSLCDRTTECAISSGYTQSIDHDVFQHRCLTALASQLTCTVPSDAGSSDFELCSDAIKEIPCDVVVMYLADSQVVAPASSCGDFFGL